MDSLVPTQCPSRALNLLGHTCNTYSSRYLRYANVVGAALAACMPLTKSSGGQELISLPRSQDSSEKLPAQLIHVTSHELKLRQYS